jgi:hypothetical protein
VCNGMTVEEAPGQIGRARSPNEGLLRRLATERHSWPPTFHTVVNCA